MSEYTSILFVRPSFLEGVARIVDFGGCLNYYNLSRSGEEADNLALWADWHAVGEDYWHATAEIAENDKVILSVIPTGGLTRERQQTCPEEKEKQTAGHV